MTRHPATDDSNPLAGVGLFALIARAGSARCRRRDRRGCSAAAGRRRRRGRRRAHRGAGDRGGRQVDARPAGRAGRPGPRRGRRGARQTVVVVNAATPVLMPWLDEVDAVLWAGLPGQEGGHAVAAALLGDIEPAGRLVTTFPAADGAAPAWDVSPIDGAIVYGEGTFIGYRGHFAGKAPAAGVLARAWPRLRHVGVRIGIDRRHRPGARRCRFDVTNTGPRSSREVVQVYARASRPRSARTTGRLDCVDAGGRRVGRHRGHYRRAAVAPLGHRAEQMGRTAPPRRPAVGHPRPGGRSHHTAARLSPVRRRESLRRSRTRAGRRGRLSRPRRRTR